MTREKSCDRILVVMRTRILPYLVLLTAAIAGNAAIAQIKAPEIVASKIWLSVDRLRPGDSFDIAVSATVKKGYHIGANDKDSLYPAKLTIEAPKTIELGPIRYAEPERKTLAIAPGQSIPVYEGTFIMRAAGRVARDARPGPVAVTSKFDSQACLDKVCFPPSVSTAQLSTSIVPAGTKIERVNSEVFASNTKNPVRVAGLPRSMAQLFSGASTPVRFAVLYALGLLLAFTPCVYPMVPVTIGYFSSQHEDKTRMAMLLAGMYVLGIALTYSILGTVAAMTNRVFGDLMQSKLVPLGLAGLLVALAASMFGFYELRPPVWVAQHARGRSGLLGALIMGLIFGVVAAPCVGPVVLGLLLYVARLGKPATGFMMFFVMSLGLGTPLFALAAFSARMPVPGTWMLAVKKIAGFLLLGAAAHFAAGFAPKMVEPYLIPAVMLSGGIYLGFIDDSIRSHEGFSMASRVGGTAAVLVAVVLAMPHAPEAGACLGALQAGRVCPGRA